LFAGAFAADPPIWCCFFCRRIRRRSTALVLLCLPAHSPPTHRFGVASFAGASPAEPPPIWRCVTWPAHSPPLWSLRMPARSPPTHRFGDRSFGRRIPSPCHHRAFWPAHPLAVPPSLFLAGASPRHATIAYLGWRILSPCPSPFFAGASPRRATITIFCRRIPSPCHHRLPRLAHPIAMPPSPILAGASHRRTALSYFTSCAETEIGFRFRDHHKSWCISLPHLHRLSRFGRSLDAALGWEISKS